MATILCLETATTNCSVALSVNGSVIALLEDQSPGYSHAEKLHDFIGRTLSDSGLGVGDLDAVAVSKGPGSYTGLRIGVSAAKGLCYSQDIPLVSVPTLTALAWQVETTGLIVPLLDARRMEVYSAVFDKDKQQLRETRAEIITQDSFSEYLKQDKVTFIGSGVDKLLGVITHPNAVYIEHKLPSAREMAPLAISKYKKSDIEDVAYFEPYYLKDFVGG